MVMLLLFALFLLFPYGTNAQVQWGVELDKVGYVRNVLGPTCNVINLGVGYPCNPANAAVEQKRMYLFSLYAGNNSLALNTAENIVNNSVDDELVRKIFDKYRVMAFQVDSSVGIRATNWNLSYEPYRVQYFSFVRNSAYPIVDLHAVKEKQVRGQIGTYLEDDLAVGLQIRGVDRTFVSGKFAFMDAISESGREVLLPKSQKAFYLEPGLMFEKKEAWDFRAGALLTNVGYVEEKYEPFVARPIFDLGVAIAPPIEGCSRWDIGLNYRHFSEFEKPEQGISLTSTVAWDVYQYTSMFAKNRFALGVLITSHPLEMGLIYLQEKISFDEMKSIYINLGLAF